MKLNTQPDPDFVSYITQFNAWSSFLAQCNIPDDTSAGCKNAHLDTIFISTNFEEDKGTEENVVNLDDALMRFEFMEAVLRVARAKFIDSKPVVWCSFVNVLYMHCFAVSITATSAAGVAIIYICILSIWHYGYYS